MEQEYRTLELENARKWATSHGKDSVAETCHHEISAFVQKGRGKWKVRTFAPLVDGENVLAPIEGYSFTAT